ncbi:hypothetical protein ES703_32170 [subsurface metagenome]
MSRTKLKIFKVQVEVEPGSHILDAINQAIGLANKFKCTIIFVLYYTHIHNIYYAQ